MAAATAPQTEALKRAPKSTIGDAKHAAIKVRDQHTLNVTLPDNRTVRLPEPEQLAFYGGIAVLAAFGLIEWPFAVVIGVAHFLAEDHHHKCLCEFGEALAEA